MTILPVTVKADLARHLDRVRYQHELDLQHGAGRVEIPGGLMRKYPNAGREWCRQWCFPATRLCVDKATGHKDVKTTMVYTHVLNRGGKRVRSPMDLLPPKAG